MKTAYAHRAGLFACLAIAACGDDGGPEATSRIVYIETTVESGVPVSRLATAHADGSGHQVLSTEPIGEVPPRPSPDGLSILFAGPDLSGVDYQWRIMPSAGGSSTPLPAPDSVRSPVWSTTGASIAWALSRPSPQLVIASPGNTAMTVLTPSNIAFRPEAAWSLDGTRIALQGTPDGGNPNLYVAGVNGDFAPLLVEPSEDYQPDWSIANGRIAFTRMLGPDAGIYTIAPDGTDLRLVTHGVFNRSQWSPDGTQLAVFRFDEAHNPLGIARVNVATGAVTPVLMFNLPISGYMWSPDGRYLVYTRFEATGRNVIVTIDMSGQVRQVSSSAANSSMPSWIP